MSGPVDLDEIMYTDDGLPVTLKVCAGCGAPTPSWLFGHNYGCPRATPIVPPSERP